MLDTYYSYAEDVKDHRIEKLQDELVLREMPLKLKDSEIAELRSLLKPTALIADES